MGGSRASLEAKRQKKKTNIKFVFWCDWCSEISSRKEQNWRKACARIFCCWLRVGQSESKLIRTVVTNSRRYQCKSTVIGSEMRAANKNEVYFSSFDAVARHWCTEFKQKKMHKFACGAHWSFWLNSIFHGVRWNRQSNQNCKLPVRNVFYLFQVHLFLARFFSLSVVSEHRALVVHPYFVLTNTRMLPCTVFSLTAQVDWFGFSLLHSSIAPIIMMSVQFSTFGKFTHTIMDRKRTDLVHLAPNTCARIGRKNVFE